MCSYGLTAILSSSLLGWSGMKISHCFLGGTEGVDILREEKRKLEDCATTEREVASEGWRRRASIDALGRRNRGGKPQKYLP